MTARAQPDFRDTTPLFRGTGNWHRTRRQVIEHRDGQLSRSVSLSQISTRIVDES